MNYLGLDLGSVSLNTVLISETGDVVFELYERTQGQPVLAIKRSLRKLAVDAGIPAWQGIGGAATTGSGRRLAGAVVGADLIKNEITAHATAAIFAVPDVRTVIEIGGQDSKIILIKDGKVVDFAMNTVCAAGTGSFLDQQCGRLGINIEDFGSLALQSQNDVSIAGRCTVFAESDMIHKQQLGARREDIIRGLCASLVRNYLGNVAKGKKIQAPIVFQGGVAANQGIVKEFETTLKEKIIIPEHFDVMGALGAALLVKEKMRGGAKSVFKGDKILTTEYESTSFRCPDCPNHCEVVELKENGAVIARWGDRCGKYSL